MNGTKVLLVEDNMLGRAMVSTFLEERGFDCSVAANGLEALDVLAKSTFDLILLDIEMPQLNGYLTARNIRTLGLTAPIIALTAHASAHQETKCINAGMNACITKPFDPKALYALILQQLLPAAVETNAPSEKKTAPAETVIDLTFLHQISKGRKDFFLSMIDIFIEQNRDDLKALADAIHYPDYETIRILSHKIKTSISFMGLEKHLYERLQEMENLAEAQSGMEQINERYHVVANTCAKAERELLLIQEKERSR